MLATITRQFTPAGSLKRARQLNPRFFVDPLDHFGGRMKTVSSIADHHGDCDNCRNYRKRDVSLLRVRRANALRSNIGQVLQNGITLVWIRKIASLAFASR